MPSTIVAFRAVRLFGQAGGQRRGRPWRRRIRPAHRWPGRWHPPMPRTPCRTRPGNPAGQSDQPADRAPRGATTPPGRCPKPLRASPLTTVQTSISGLLSTGSTSSWRSTAGAVSRTTAAPSGKRRPIESVNEPCSSAWAIVSRMETAQRSMPRNSTTCQGARRSACSGSARSEPIRPGRGAEQRRDGLVLGHAGQVDVDDGALRPNEVARQNFGQSIGSCRGRAVPQQARPRRASRSSSRGRAGIRPGARAARRWRRAPAGCVRAAPCQRAEPGGWIQRHAHERLDRRAHLGDRRPFSPLASAWAIDCSMMSTPLSGKERLGRNWSASAMASSSTSSPIVTPRALPRLSRTDARTIAHRRRDPSARSRSA